MSNQTIEEKAAMWDALMSCGRIRMVGTAGLNTPGQHIGMEFWNTYPDVVDAAPHAASKKVFTQFVAAMAEYPAPSFQRKVQKWMRECFNQEVADDGIERCYRFFEEAIELVQAAGLSRTDCDKLLDYVYSRSVGQVEQEVGGVVLTLAALCTAYGGNMAACGNAELAAVSVVAKLAALREKQKTKPHNSPLPGTAEKD